MFPFGTIIATQFIRSFLDFLFQLPRKEVGHISETAKFSLNTQVVNYDISVECGFYLIEQIWNKSPMLFMFPS